MDKGTCAAGINWTGSGSGPPVLLIHGVGLCAASWQLQVPALAKSNTVYTIDLPGHGSSDSLKTESTSVAELSASVVDFIMEVIKEPALLIGHSLGALMVLHQAIHHPRWCRGIILLSPVYQRSIDSRNAVIDRAIHLLSGRVSDAASAPISRWFPDTRESDQQWAIHCKHWLDNAAKRNYPQVYLAFAQADDPDQEQLNNLGIPALVISAEHDPNSTPSMARKLAHQIPNAGVLIIPEARHMLQLTHANVINQALEQFVAKSIVLQES